MKALFISSLFLLVPVFSFSQSGQVINYGNYSNSYFGLGGLVDNQGNNVVLYKNLAGSYGIVKYDPVYNFIWSLNFSVSYSGGTIEQLANGDYFVTTTNGTASEIIRINPIGVILWSHKLSGTLTATKFIENAAGDLFILGDVSTGNYVMRLSSSGSIMWSKRFDQASSVDINPCDIINTFDGKILVVSVGTDFNNPGNYFAYFQKIDAAGNVIWQRTYPSTSLNPGKIVQSMLDKSFYCTGVFMGGSNTDAWDALAFKVDSLGNFVAAKSYGYTHWDEGYDIVKTGDNDYVICGSCKPNQICGENVMYIKINSNLDTMVTKVYGVSAGAGALFRTMKRYGSTFYSTGGGSLWANIGPSDVQMLKMDSTLTLPCKRYIQPLTVASHTYTLGTNNLAWANMTVSYVAPNTPGQINFIAFDGCTAQQLAVAENKMDELHFNVYPNPSSGSVTIRNEKNIQYSLKIYDVIGEMVAGIKSDESELNFDASSLPNGIYDFIFEKDGSRSSKRVIISK